MCIHLLTCQPNDTLGSGRAGGRCRLHHSPRPHKKPKIEHSARLRRHSKASTLHQRSNVRKWRRLYSGRREPNCRRHLGGRCHGGSWNIGVTSHFQGRQLYPTGVCSRLYGMGCEMSNSLSTRPAPCRRDDWQDAGNDQEGKKSFDGLQRYAGSFGLCGGSLGTENALSWMSPRNLG